MRNENPLLKEKEITRDYYLKRMLIWQQISGFVPSVVLVLLLLFAINFVTIRLWGWKISSGQKDETKNDFLLAVLIGVTLFSIFVVSTYYSRQYWKAHKECQELANPTLSTETERERERDKFRS